MELCCSQTLMMMSRTLTVVKVVCLTLLALGLCDVSSARQRGPNCGLKCFRWKKCMNQLSGNENRPHQLGNTGQIVLNTCSAGPCDCLAEEQKKLDAATTTTTATPPATREIEAGSPSSSRFVRKGLTSRSRNLNRPKKLASDLPLATPELVEEETATDPTLTQTLANRFQPSRRRLFRQRY